MDDQPDRVSVTVVVHRSDRQTGQSVEGHPGPVAAWLRAVAGQLDPPAATTPADGSPGPAKGLITQVRPTAEHRNPNARSNFGFAPVKAEET